MILLAAAFAVAEITKAPPGTVRMPSPPLLFTNPVLPGTNELPRLESGRLDGNSAPPPGIYLTKPYCAMVKVPGAVPDDMAQRDVPPFTNAMPVIRPELKLEPPKLEVP